MSGRSRLSPLLAVALAALAGASVAEELAVERAWVRALPPTQSTTAAYLTLRNNSTSAHRIVSATAELADRVEFHHSIQVDGLTRMQQLPALDVAAGATLELAPGGIHLMLLGLTRMPVAGDTLQICLQPDSGAATCTRATVRREAEAGADDGDLHQHH